MYTVVNFGLIKEFQAFGLGKVLLNSLIQKLKNTVNQFIGLKFTDAVSSEKA